MPNSKSHFDALVKGDVSLFTDAVGGFRCKTKEPIEVGAHAVCVVRDNISPVQPGETCRNESYLSQGKGDAIEGYIGPAIPLPESVREYWATHHLGRETRIYTVHNPTCGATGLRLNIDSLEVGKPVLINTGYLGGCAVLFGLDTPGKRFYCLHAGGTTINTRVDGVSALIDAYNELRDYDKANSEQVAKPESIDYTGMLTVGDAIGESVVVYLDKGPKEFDDLQPTDRTTPYNYYRSPELLSGRAYCLLVKTKDPKDQAEQCRVHVFVSQDAESMTGPGTMGPDIGKAATAKVLNLS